MVVVTYVIVRKDVKRLQKDGTPSVIIARVTGTIKIINLAAGNFMTWNILIFLIRNLIE